MNKKKDKAKKGFSTFTKMFVTMIVTGILLICYVLFPFWLYVLCGYALFVPTWYALRDAGEAFFGGKE